ncbi:hypothetical protein [Streptomyces sp. CdTB01]|nr:hypothetical protein [Streptomyces sp. CdTB01]
MVTFQATRIGAVARWKLRGYDDRYPSRHEGADADPEPASA